MIRKDGYLSTAKGSVYWRAWLPEAEVRATLQIAHGVAEHGERYAEFAEYMTARGFAVYADDHAGHGRSIGAARGFFAEHNGWLAVVDDLKTVCDLACRDFPDVPHFLFGHSMGSFLTRSLLIQYPKTPLAGVILSGTGWQPAAALNAGRAVYHAERRKRGVRAVSPALNRLMFGGFNGSFKPCRTEHDWLSRDSRQVDAYESDPLCGFDITVGLAGDLLCGIRFNQKRANLMKMRASLPVCFLSGDCDPVGAMGRGVVRTYNAFADTGMKNLELALYEGGRHEMLNETNREDVYKFVADWFEARCRRGTPMPETHRLRHKHTGLLRRDIR